MTEFDIEINMCEAKNLIKEIERLLDDCNMTTIKKKYPYLWKLNKLLKLKVGGNQDGNV